MGTYARAVNADTLLRAKNNRDSSAPSEDIARLAGIRMASVGEIPQGSQLDAARVKLLTGGDTVNARFLGENSFDFIPQFKLLLHTNHLPSCSDNSVFASGRVLVLPFSRHFDENEQDKNLKQEFKTPEMQSVILNWLLEGLKMYLIDGLKIPDIVKDATNDYRIANDKVSRFVDEEMERDPNSKVTVTFVYESYRTWCYTNGLHFENSRAFTERLKALGIEIKRDRPTDSKNPTTVLCGYRMKIDNIE
jgi:putative DNA primase/helicase